jgi:hypothetical protein
MARANVPSLWGTEHQLRPKDREGGRDVVLPRMIDVTSKHLSILGIDEKLGDTMSGLALIALPSLSKYHPGRSSEASEKGGLVTGYITGNLELAYPLLAQPVEGT